MIFFQDLTITITTERPDTEIDLIPDENEMSGINVQTFVDQQVILKHVQFMKPEKPQWGCRRAVVTITQ